MKSNNASKPLPKRRWKRLICWGLLALLGLLILGIAFLPAFVSTSPVRKLVLARINQAIQGQAEIGAWSWGWFSGVNVQDLHFRDSLGLTRLTVKGIQARPVLRSLLGGRLALQQTVIDQPKVTLSTADIQTDNAAGSPASESKEVSAAPVLPISQLDMEIRNGIVEVVHSENEKTTLSRINSQVRLDTAQGQAGFSLAMAVQGKEGEGAVQADIAVEQVQIDSWNFTETSGRITVDVNTLDLGSLEALLSLGGLDLNLKGMANARLNGEIRQGQLENLKGNLSASNVDVTGPGFFGDRVASAQVDARIEATRQDKHIQVSALSLACDWLKTDLRASLPVGPDLSSLSKLSGSDVAVKGDFDLDMALLAAQLPHHLGLKEDTRLTQGQATGHFDLSQAQVSADFKVDGLAGQVDQTPVKLSEPIQGKVRLTTTDTGAYRVEDLNLTSSFARVQAKGDAERVEYSEWLDLERMQSELGQFLDLGGYTLRGQMTGEGVAHLGESDVALAGLAVFRDIELAVPDGNSVSERQVQLNYDTAYDWEQGLLRLADLQAKAEWGQIGLQAARLDLKADQMQGELSVKALQLQHLLPYLGVFASAPAGMSLQGLAQGDYSLARSEGVLQVVTDNTVVEQFELSMPDKQPFKQSSMTVALQARMNPAAKAVNVETFQFVSPEFKITKAQFQHQAQADTAVVKAAAECEYDLQAIGELLAPLVPAGLDMAGNRTGHISFTSTYPSAQPQELWRSAQGQARFGFDQASYQGLNFGPTDVNAIFSQGVLEIEPFQTEVNQGQLSFACQTDFRQTPAQVVLPEPRQVAQGIHITQETTQTLFRYVNPIFANLSSIEGKADFHCEKLAIPLDPNAQDQIEVVGTVSMDKIYLEGSGLLTKILSGLQMENLRRQALKMHPTRFVLRQGVLQYDDMQIDVGDNPVNFAGAIGLDESLDMRVTTPYTTSGRTVRSGDPDQGQRVTVALTGTLDRPVIDMESVLDQLLQMGIQRGLQELLKF